MAEVNEKLGTSKVSHYMTKEWALFLVVATGSAIGLGMGLFDKPKTNFTAVEADLADLDFGEVWEQSSFPWTISLTNTSNQAVEIVNVHSTCSCAVTNGELGTLRPGESRDVQMTIDLTKNGEMTPTATVFPFAVNIMPEIRGHLPGGIKFTLHGRVRTAYADLPRTIRWIDDFVEGMPSVAHEIEIRCVRDMRDLSMVFPNATVSPLSLINGAPHANGNRVFRFRVHPNADVPHGPLAMAGTVIGVLAEGETIPAVPITIRADVKPYVAPSNDHAHFGIVDFGSDARAEIKWHAADDGPFELVSVASDTTHATAAITSADCIAISLKSDVLGPIQGNVNVTIESSIGTRTVQIPVQGHVMQSSVRHVNTANSGSKE